MKLSLKAVAAPLALCALGAIALALELSGGVHGRWTQIDRTTVVANGMLHTLKEVPVFRFNLTLNGTESGKVVGTLQSLPLPDADVPAQLYRVAGSFTRLPEGRRVVDGDILTQTDAGEWTIVVGSLDAMLDVRPTQHVHGRWLIKP
jgi:hypothetical protein